MATDIIANLERKLAAATAKLKGIESKKMFGCHALRVNDNIFALVWKEGRLGFKLPDPVVFEQLLKKPGAAVWKAGDRVISQWVLVPESMHKKSAELAQWAAKAHELCAALTKPVKVAKKAKKIAKKATKKAKKKATPKARR